MPGDTRIEWADRTWNPITGCVEVSPGCTNCYARTFAERFRGVPGHPYEQGFDLRLWPERLTIPKDWKKPKRIFVNSMSDLFHQDIPDAFIIEVFATMYEADWHIYQILTKRPSRLTNTDLSYKIQDRLGPWPKHIWLGVSVENNDYIWRIDKLTKTSAPIKFISAEPLLGELTNIQLSGVDWVIAGAESGHGARPMDENWVRHLRDRCQEYHIAFFYKQNAINGHKIPTPELDGKVWKEYPTYG